SNTSSAELIKVNWTHYDNTLLQTVGFLKNLLIDGYENVCMFACGLMSFNAGLVGVEFESKL
ncbi:hypothetical protein, partial [Archaeoglobus sp.]